jgi:hypothetical protein
VPIPEPIKVEGLRALRKRLRKADREGRVRLKAASNAAGQIIVDTAKPRVPLGPGKGGHARSSVKVASTNNQARVQAGGKKYPYFPWLDFGGRVGPKRKTHRPFLTEGRYIWKAFDEKRSEIEVVLEREMQIVADSIEGE